MIGLTADVTEHLDKLVSFPTISGLPNLELIDYVVKYLQANNLDPVLSYDKTGKKANLHAIIGPIRDGGVVLNGHTDVVPVAGQQWSSDPFILREDNGRLYGRGTVDMKGFLACMLAAVPIWQAKNLSYPVHISMCFDEEIGGFGAPILVESIGINKPRPAIAIIGEPTQMQIVNAHKGGYEMRTEIIGFEAHSSDPTMGVSAIQFAAEYICHLYRVADQLAKSSILDDVFHPNHSTINVGKIEGGSARNIVAGCCSFDWELRPIPGADGDKIINDIIQFGSEILLPKMRKFRPEADISTQMQANVPPLDAGQAEPAIELVKNITGNNACYAVPFGTDAGHFAEASISTIVMGPGNIEQAHKPDEYIEVSQIERCMEFFDQLGDYLST